jgi:Ser/Thr protein kinase RdoA (MazF antagonist)
LDNVVFTEHECAFLDFQMVRSGPAAYDVAYFISGALDENATADEREALLRGYHDALAIADYDYPSFRRDYDRALMIVLAVLSANDAVQLGEGRGDAMMRAWLRRLGASVRPIDPDSLLD